LLVHEDIINIRRPHRTPFSWRRFTRPRNFGYLLGHKSLLNISLKQDAAGKTFDIKLLVSNKLLCPVHCVRARHCRSPGKFASFRSSEQVFFSTPIRKMDDPTREVGTQPTIFRCTTQRPMKVQAYMGRAIADFIDGYSRKSPIGCSESCIVHCRAPRFLAVS
jgi:hypothetical protein